MDKNVQKIMLKIMQIHLKRRTDRALGEVFFWKLSGIEATKI